MPAPDAPKLTTAFYTSGALAVAPKLLGKTLLHSFRGRLRGGVISEVEAYTQHGDEASHSFRGQTPGNLQMFMGGGVLYVYFVYGAHFCCNVVTGRQGSGEAVLIRSILPVYGIPAMLRARYGTAAVERKALKNLTNGPGKVCAAMGIGKRHNGVALTGGRVFILDAPAVPRKKIGVSARIGITRSANLQRRFFILPPFLHEFAAAEGV